ncbi:hypothetical protein BN874_1790005 [Candidatus Contendobacter odensis Run_B_J11]|uniref:Uncharacterized protein n=1 Tax=Candidatus Contendobacter odensis Run_B_J11 TaxID=1400861 RepID=A0A7U7J2X7_9GAMM|nr:hypothetical protein BN874_1790005 [Candidatus Contendobacter odensis Run_B_J11]
MVKASDVSKGGLRFANPPYALFATAKLPKHGNLHYEQIAGDYLLPIFLSYHSSSWSLFFTGTDTGEE